MIGLSVSDSSFRKQFSAVLAQTERPTGMLMVVGRELSNQLRKHFRQNEAAYPNALSSRREHFWLQVMRSTHPPEQTGYNAVSVWVSDPRFAQKVFGGTIRAKLAKALTLPVEEQAYGRTAATFEQETGLKLFLVRTGKGNFENAVLAVAGPGKTLQVEYLLTPEVTQQPDPHALPDMVALRQQLLERAQKVVEREQSDGTKN